MYVVPLKSESGDSYLFGPFSQVPTHDEVVAVFRAANAEEADYCEELGYSQRDGAEEGTPGIGAPVVGQGSFASGSPNVWDH